jgi:hypothetical protein
LKIGLLALKQARGQIDGETIRREGENLLGSVESGGFQPLMLQRDGFFLSEKHIAIDRGHPRFSETDGDPLFDAAQQPADALAIAREIADGGDGRNREPPDPFHR